ncbi:MAG: hypothetical protein WDN02_17015 [Methylovirgula sp.]|uniref:hypothetical protein n=1 Tax=Methylovirgula sp. TaxID=1978224 RepID=UPI00307673D6
MDSSADPQAFDDKKSESVPEGAADAAPAAPGEANNTSHALTKFEPKAATSASGAESEEPPEVESFPGSALVILPPQKEKIGSGFSAGERLGGPARMKRSSLTNNAMRAAAVLLIAGGAYAVGSHYLSAPGSAPAHAAMVPQSATVAAIAPPATEATPSAVSVGSDEPQLAALRHETVALNSEVHKLQARLAALQGEPDQMRSLRKSLDGLKAGFEAEKADYKAQIAQLTAKLDHAHAATAEKARVARLDAQAIQATLDRAARTETTSGDSTGSIPNAAAPSPVTLASAVAPRHASQPLNDWVVRDVYRGIALVEGPQGAIEVMPGDTLPGAGTVRAIERRGDGWVVVTSRGYVDYEHD